MQLVSQQENSRVDHRVGWYEKQVYLPLKSLAHETPGEHQPSFLQQAQNNHDCVTSNCLQPLSLALLPHHGVESSSPSSSGHGSLGSCKRLSCSEGLHLPLGPFHALYTRLVGRLTTNAVRTLASSSAQRPQQQDGICKVLSLDLESDPEVTSGISPERDAHSLAGTP